MYCKDKDRTKKEERIEFDFLGYAFKAIYIKCRDGKMRYNFIEWCVWLEELAASAKALDRTELSAQLADTLEGKETLLRILNMNLFEIEQNSRMERLAEFKKLFQRLVNG